MFGIVEGITEWLPISSTGHMILLNEFVTLDVSPEFWEMFLVVIQLGAIMAVVVLFWNKIFPFDLGRKRKKSIIKTDIFVMWFKILIACIPAMIYGIFLDDIIEPYLYNATTVAIMLILFGAAFIIIENWNKGKKPKVNSLAALTYKDALIIGLFHPLVIKGEYYFGTRCWWAFLVTGILCAGLSLYVENVYLSIIFGGASLLKLVKFGFHFTMTEASLLIVGMVVAFAVSMGVISFLMGYIKKHDFKVFGWYRIVLGIVVLVYFYLIAA